MRFKKLAKNWKKGFTLIELIVVLVVFGVLTMVLFTVFDPLKQFDRGRDTKRQSDIAQVAKALDLYYQDHNYYIDQTTLTPLLINGGTLTSGPEIVMKTVPYDKTCTYQYRTGSASPQWAVLFAKLLRPPSNTTICALSARVSCAPPGFDSTWSCIVLGDPDCAALTASSQLVTCGNQSTSPTPTPNITPTVIPTCTPKNYACRGTPLHCNIVAPGTGDYCDPTCGGQC